MTKASGNGLTLLTNDVMPKTFKDSCVVKQDGVATKFEEHVTVGFDMSKGTHTLLYNADALTLGYAFIMVHNAYSKALKELPAEIQEEIISTLRGEAE